jgi:cysteine desulfurase
MDYNATTPVHPLVLEALLPFYRDYCGNPSSIHSAGRRARAAVEEAREQVARFVNCDPVEVVFTSCGTEADNMAIKGVAAAQRGKGNHVITSRVEHPAVLATCDYLVRDGYEVTLVDVDGQGMIDLEHLEAAIGPRTILISLMYANNETGTIFPVREIGDLAARHRVWFHCDAVQAAGRLPIDCLKENVQLLSLSAHKMYAPKGVGALVVRKGVKLHPLIHGGSQERNRRGGTENVAGIVAFGKACELAQEALDVEPARLAGLRDRLEQGIVTRVPEVRVNGHPERRLPNVTNLSFPDTAADTLLANLDLAGIAVSSGAACSSGTLKRSHVLAAMGVAPAEAGGSLRFSLGWENSEDDVAYVLEVLPEIVARLRGSEK